jgi:uncharacterized membrane protein YfcA
MLGSFRSIRNRAPVLASIVILLAAGASAGFLSGLLGIAGGLLVVAALTLALPALGIPSALVMHVSVATAMAANVLTLLSAAAAHIRQRSVVWPTWRWLASGLVIGGFLGAHLTQLLSAQALRWVVAVFCAYMAWRMALGRRHAREPNKPECIPRTPWLLPAGTGIGALSALVGIGGGSMIVPLLVALGIKPVKAVSTSAVCGLTIAVSTVLSYVLTVHGPRQALPWGSVGYLYLPAAAVVAVGSMSLAPIGARVAHGISGAALTRIFAAFLLVVGVLIAAGK